MIVTLTLNPAVDKSTEIENLVPEKKMRCATMQTDAGGGGINISKAIQELGGRSIAVFTCGGINGKVLTHLVNNESITAQAIEIKEETRESFVVNELQTNKQFRFVMPGPSLSAEELQKIKEAVAALDKASFLISSGSLPPNVPAEFLGDLADIARSRGIRFIVDTSGPPLKAALEKGVYLLKPNLTELCSLVSKPHLDMVEIEDAAMQVIQTKQCEIMVVSMGPSGAMLVTKNEIKQFRAPVVKKQTTVGAGDSMVAGIVWMIDHGKSIADAVRFGIACGSAATINKGTQLFKKEDALRFYDWMAKNG
ncbi:MAG: 1-phosphofructokinase family hexose kinase [Chitinophagaceae bacterium]|nr:MAG: 1-phosphofructokinase family hexose kinase [Chitinophagaceae bacterium]